MATVFTTAHGHHGMSGATPRVAGEPKSKQRGVLATFVRDLIEDLKRKPLQADTPQKHDMFREHINAMAIAYFALIVLLIVASLPILLWLIRS
jgi:hypothetical protein